MHSLSPLIVFRIHLIIYISFTEIPNPEVQTPPIYDSSAEFKLYTENVHVASVLNI